MVLALTKKITALIYSTNSKIFEIQFLGNSRISESAENLVLDLFDEQVVYFWYRFLEIILSGTKSNLKMIPDLHTALCKSMASIVDIILEVCNSRIQPKPFDMQNLFFSTNSSSLAQSCKLFYEAHLNYTIGLCRLPMPSIDSILDHFGFWLFYHAQIDPAYDAFGKSVIISLLCRIFSQAQSPARIEYINKFYIILLESISNGNQRVIGEILKSSTDLISLNQNTIDFLMRPDGFIQYLTLYLCDKDTELAIRTACYSILSTFSALPNCYHLVDFSKHVLEIFLSALGLESDNENFCRLV